MADASAAHTILLLLCYNIIKSPFEADPLQQWENSHFILSASILHTFFLLYFLFCANEIRFLRIDVFCIALWKQTALGVFPFLQGLSFLSCLTAITPAWATSIYLPTPLLFFFFWKKGLVKCTNTGRLQWKSRAEKPFPQLCFSKAWNKLDLPETAFCRVTLQTSCFLEPIATPITWARAQHFLNLRLLPDVIQCNHSAVDLVLRISVSKHTILSWCFSYLKELYSACLNKE